MIGNNVLRHHYRIRCVGKAGQWLILSYIKLRNLAKLINSVFRHMHISVAYKLYGQSIGL